MNRSSPVQTDTPSLGNLISSTLMRRCFLVIPVALACFAVPTVTRAEDRGNNNTSDGGGALSGLTTGAANTALGGGVLVKLSTADCNTAVGSNALYANTADGNTAVGCTALLSNTT